MQDKLFHHVQLHQVHQLLINLNNNCTTLPLKNNFVKSLFSNYNIMIKPQKGMKQFIVHNMMYE